MLCACRIAFNEHSEGLWKRQQLNLIMSSTMTLGMDKLLKDHLNGRTQYNDLHHHLSLLWL
jgi:hypothetical protein